MLTRGWAAATRVARRAAHARCAAPAAWRCAAAHARCAAAGALASARCAQPLPLLARRRAPPCFSRGWGSAAGGAAGAAGGRDDAQARPSTRPTGAKRSDAPDAAAATAQDAADADTPVFEDTFDVEDEGDALDDEQDGSDSDEEALYEDEEEDYEPSMSTGGVAWGDSALAAARKLLEAPPFASVLEMYSFRVYPSAGRIVVRLDKLADRFGSPTVDELAAFSGALDTALDAAGVSPDELTVEVSSAGAEREVRVPRDLERFAALPMLVKYRPAAGAEPLTEALQLLQLDAAAGVTHWRLADVRRNRGGLKKGQPMSKKARERRIQITLPDLLKVNLLIDL